MIYLLPAILLLAAALALLWKARKQRQAAGLPGGRVIYADPKLWGPVEEPLYDPALGLAGKPDYLVEQGGKIIPVEVKTGRTPAVPHDAHIFQVAAYCMLVERVLGNRPKYGILHYPDRTYAVDYTDELEEALLDLMAEMRRQERRGEAGRSHEEWGRCKGCGYRSICDERL
ncbi:MAG: CRISPR-associated protein Cas4 [Chloroflexi bacterium]|nr:CRISPR-associated protein Cas4 [Chloroflexota bacterium]